MPGKIPKIPIFDELLGTEKRIQQLQQKIAELDWLEYSFGLAKRVIITRNEEEEQAPVVYTGVTSDPLDMRLWPDDVYRSYAFWNLIDAAEFEYFDNVNAHRRYPKIQQPVALIVCLDNQKISANQDNNVTHSICRNELIEKLNRSNVTGGIFEITSIIENLPEVVFDGYDIEDNLHEPFSLIRVEGVLTFTQDCTI